MLKQNSMPWSYSQKCFDNFFVNYGTIHYVNIHLVLAGFRHLSKCKDTCMSQTIRMHP